MKKKISALVVCRKNFRMKNTARTANIRVMLGMSTFGFKIICANVCGRSFDKYASNVQKKMMNPAERMLSPVMIMFLLIRTAIA